MLFHKYSVKLTVVKLFHRLFQWFGERHHSNFQKSINILISLWVSSFYVRDITILFFVRMLLCFYSGITNKKLVFGCCQETSFYLKNIKNIKSPLLKKIFTIRFLKIFMKQKFLGNYLLSQTVENDKKCFNLIRSHQSCLLVKLQEVIYEDIWIYLSVIQNNSRNQNNLQLLVLGVIPSLKK